MQTRQKLACVVQLSVNPAGGVPKYRVSKAEVTVNGVVGDKQRDQRNHGGLDRAVSLYSFEHIQALQAEGHMIVPGSTGENLTISGLDWEALRVGDRLWIGECLRVEITGYALPCTDISESFTGGQFTRVSEKVNPGWSRFYARVLNEGTVCEGDVVVQDGGEG